MKLLVLDTSASVCHVVLLNNDVISELQQPSAMSQGKLILPAIKKLLVEQNVNLADLDAIAYVAGPGSFTGLRIATSVIQAFGFAFNLPIIALSSLAVLAQTAYLVQQATHVLVAKDARMGQVYWGAYELNIAGLMQACQPDQLIAPDQVVLPSKQDWQCVGEAWEIYKETLRPLTHSMLNISLTPTADALIQLAQADFVQNKSIKVVDAIPSYLNS